MVRRARSQPATKEIAEFRIRRYDPTGELLTELAIPYRSHLVDDSVKAWIEREARGIATHVPPAWKITPQGVIDATWIPDRLPPVRQVLADEEGFWVRREMTSPGLWERYDLRGRLVMRITLPATLQGLGGRPRSLLGFNIDSLDVPIVHFYDVSLAERTGEE